MSSGSAPLLAFRFVSRRVAHIASHSLRDCPTDWSQCVPAGIIDASITLSPSRPLTRNSGSEASSSESPIAQRARRVEGHQDVVANPVSERHRPAIHLWLLRGHDPRRDCEEPGGYQRIGKHRRPCHAPNDAGDNPHNGDGALNSEPGA